MMTVKNGERISAARGSKNAVYKKMHLKGLIQCALDSKLKDTCSHRNLPPEQSPCGACLKCNAKHMDYEGYYGNKINFIPANEYANYLKIQKETEAQNNADS